MWSSTSSAFQTRSTPVLREGTLSRVKTTDLIGWGLAVKSCDDLRLVPAGCSGSSGHRVMREELSFINFQQSFSTWVSIRVTAYHTHTRGYKHCRILKHWWMDNKNDLIDKANVCCLMYQSMKIHAYSYNIKPLCTCRQCRFICETEVVCSRQKKSCLTEVECKDAEWVDRCVTTVLE